MATGSKIRWWESSGQTRSGDLPRSPMFRHFRRFPEFEISGSPGVHNPSGPRLDGSSAALRGSFGVLRPGKS